MEPLLRVKSGMAYRIETLLVTVIMFPSEASSVDKANTMAGTRTLP
jgi:hypothetical protein